MVEKIGHRHARGGKAQRCLQLIIHLIGIAAGTVGIFRPDSRTTLASIVPPYLSVQNASLTQTPYRKLTSAAIVVKVSELHRMHEFCSPRMCDAFATTA